MTVFIAPKEPIYLFYLLIHSIKNYTLYDCKKSQSALQKKNCKNQEKNYNPTLKPTKVKVIKQIKIISTF